jgi:predicted ABC-type ATPase
MLQRLSQLAGERRSFAFESTLASRSFKPWLEKQITAGYSVYIVFLWLPSSDMAIGGVSDRVARGGHDVPELIMRRRHAAGLRNFFGLYSVLDLSWSILGATSLGAPGLIAAGHSERVDRLVDTTRWASIVREWS